MTRASVTDQEAPPPGGASSSVLPKFRRNPAETAGDRRASGSAKHLEHFYSASGGCGRNHLPSHAISLKNTVFARFEGPFARLSRLGSDFRKIGFFPKHVNLPFALFINASINSFLRFFPTKRGRPRTTGLSSGASQAPTQDHRGASSGTVRRRTWRSTDRRFRCGPCRPRRRRS